MALPAEPGELEHVENPETRFVAASELLEESALGTVATAAEVEAALRDLAADPRDQPPDRWDEWLRFLAGAVNAGGYRPAGG